MEILMPRARLFMVMAAIGLLGACGEHKSSRGGNDAGLDGDGATFGGDGSAGRADGGSEDGDGATSHAADCACDDLKPVCLEDVGECVECTDDERGACRGPTPFCADHRCVGCLETSDCIEPRAPVCTDGACVACTSDAECGAGMLCDVASGRCGECTGARREACTGAGGEAVCDVLALTCSDAAPGSAGACQNCVSDAHCAAGHACVEQRIGSVVVGTFCMPVAVGASCVRPYTERLENATSIEGVTLSVCGPKQTTCPALVGRSGYGASCGVDAAGLPTSSGAVAGDDRLCGMKGVDDAVCVNGDQPTDFRCTLLCGEGTARDVSRCPSDSRASPGMTPICKIAGIYPSGAEPSAGNVCSF